VIHIGFSGSRHGLASAQRAALGAYLGYEAGEQNGEWIGHHGDCVGGDATFDELARGQPGYHHMHIHPPNNPTLRAYCQLEPEDVLADEEEYSERNRRIVAYSDLLLAAPRSAKRSAAC